MSEHPYTNDLIHESSPYLLQHAHNPVDWKPWNKQVLEEAKASKKLMIISIGYAACHWCHVMEKESFEDSTVAAIMNEHYISIKVDREERPDVDQTYINAVQLMTGNAGWPLNVITLPDGRPIFGGTYFQKEAWMQALDQIQELYETEPQKLMEYASRLEEGIKSLDLIQLNTDTIDFSTFDLVAPLDQWKNSLDTIDGGSRGAPKFMMPNQLQFLLRIAAKNNDQELKKYVNLTLEQMAFGGLYDQVGGGFARYSTDERWHVPHFEKMLYDNAQLVSLYSQAYRLEKNPLYKKIVKETLEFIHRDLSHEEGVFYSSLDADSDNSEGILEEGAFYTYTMEELKNLIIDDWNLFAAYYNVNEYGLWKEEQKYVLIRTLGDDQFAAQHSITEEELHEKVATWKSTLMLFRESRPHPRLDDKTLTSWNALMLSAYVEAYKSFQEPTYLEAALKNAEFIRAKQQRSDGGLFHSYKKGKSTINGYLEDYAAVIDAFIALYEITLNQEYLLNADSFAKYAYDHFYDEQKHMFYFTSSDDDEIITRNFDYRDNVIPSSNSMMAKNLFRLAHHFDNATYRETALQMLKNVLPEMNQYPTSFSNWFDLLANNQTKYYEVVVVGEQANLVLLEINQHYLPNVLIAGSQSSQSLPLLEERYVKNRTLIYVCVNNTCKLPVENISEALKLLED